MPIFPRPGPQNVNSDSPLPVWEVTRVSCKELSFASGGWNCFRSKNSPSPKCQLLVDPPWVQIAPLCELEKGPPPQDIDHLLENCHDNYTHLWWLWGDRQPWSRGRTAHSAMNSPQSPGSLRAQWSLVVTGLPGIHSVKAADTEQQFRLFDSGSRGHSLEGRPG